MLDRVTEHQAVKRKKKTSLWLSCENKTLKQCHMALEVLYLLILALCQLAKVLTFAAAREKINA